MAFEILLQLSLFKYFTNAVRVESFHVWPYVLCNWNFNVDICNQYLHNNKKIETKWVKTSLENATVKLYFHVENNFG